MYWLMSIDALARIAFAIALLFVIVPALARPRHKPSTFLEGFFWNVGIGITIITLAGQLFSLANLFSLLTILTLAALVILIGRSTEQGKSPWFVVRRSAENAFLALLNIFDGRVNVPRRIKRSFRRTLARLRSRTISRASRIRIAAWTALTLIAFGFRLYRPLASANLGFSDTYVHLYLLKLLEIGRQVDPDWGPYPRGLHFLLVAIHELTNIDEILLMNFFGAFAGVLMTLSVADAARRLTKSVVAGLAAGFLFATLIGGPGQYFILGGAFETDDPAVAATVRHEPYRALVDKAGEFDPALTDFQRQTSTLPQELAIALLFPATLFLLDFLRTRQRWYLFGFAGCTAAIAAVHSGVVVPLVLMCALMLLATALARLIRHGAPRQAILTGALAVIIGSTWMLGFILYPYSGGKLHPGVNTAVPGSALFYFPFLRSLSSDANIAASSVRTFVTLTPFLAICIIAALALIVLSFLNNDDARISRFWIAAVFLLFLLMHFSSMMQWPQIVETGRNSQWLLMSIAILAGIAVSESGLLLRHLPDARAARASAATAAVVIGVLWLVRIPRLTDPVIHDRIVNYSGYGGSALAVLRIEESFEPYTWTIVSYGQEFPMVLRRGFHLDAADFLERYDPTTDIVPIPTPDFFVIVEKKPHKFQINIWAQRFTRTDLEQRLQTWMQLYQATHRNVRIYFEDENVRVYRIERTRAELVRLSQR